MPVPEIITTAFGQERIERDWRLMKRLPGTPSRPPSSNRRSYWHMSKTITSGMGLTNVWLADQGLLSMKTLWAELAPLRRTA